MGVVSFSFLIYTPLFICSMITSFLIKSIVNNLDMKYIVNNFIKNDDVKRTNAFS